METNLAEALPMLALLTRSLNDSLWFSWLDIEEKDDRADQTHPAKSRGRGFRAGNSGRDCGASERGSVKRRFFNAPTLQRYLRSVTVATPFGPAVSAAAGITWIVVACGAK